MAKYTAKKVCNCIQLANDALKSQNCELATVLTFDFTAKVGSLAMVLPLRKIDSDKKTKLPTLFPTFCPICGRKLLKEQKLKHEVRKK